eukprot:4583170-Amphidinium_carterae.1
MVVTTEAKTLSQAGVRYDLQLLEMADTFAKDGRISLQEAEQLWEHAEDGRGVSQLERRTLRFVLVCLLKKHIPECTPKAPDNVQKHWHVGLFETRPCRELQKSTL